MTQPLSWLGSLLLIQKNFYRLFLTSINQCGDCGKFYKHKAHLSRHQKFECGKPPSFFCPFCSYQAHRQDNYRLHIIRSHSLKHYNKATKSGDLSYCQS
ncbi:hypothetical protein HUJ04_008554 [Dendroctonus ponderosae]|nr:hypothetical protein HUJ04_008554 [Dendroctonus ponderosae]